MLIRNDYRPRMTEGTARKTHAEPGKLRVYPVVFALVALLPAVLIGRSALFHINQSGKQMTVVHSTFIHNEKDLSMRGRILDRNHAVLAISEQMNDVVLDSYQIKDFAQLKQKHQNHPDMLMDVQEQEIRQKQKIEKMAQLLGLDEKETLALFDMRNYAPRGEKNPPEGKLRHGDKYLARSIDKNLGDTLKALQLGGLKVIPVEQRRYPDGYLFGQLIGFSKIDYDPAVKRERIIGIEGLEHRFNTQLSGRDGLVRVVRDNRKNSIEYAPVPEIPAGGENPYHPAVHGEDLVLTVDKNIQAAAMTALKNARRRHNADRASAVVLDAQSGEILAMANYPSFDPAQYRKHPSSSYRNNAVADSVEPGSVIKPFIVAKALEEGKIRPDTVLDTRPYFVGDKQIHDSDGRVYPQLSVAQIIQKSSNVGVVRLAMRWKAQDMHDYLYRIGIGRGSGADLPGENTVPLRPAGTWKPVEQATMSYGYGIQGNLLQFARALTAFTNDGVLLPATLIKSDTPAQGERIFSEKTARQVRQMMHLVTEKGGTGTRAAVNGYDVGGKSGTAEICFFDKARKGCRYSKDRHRALFAGFAPVDNPRVIVVVSLENPKNREAGYSGGRVAAPVFGEITASALNIMGVPPTRELHINTVAGLSE